MKTLELQLESDPNMGCQITYMLVEDPTDQEVKVQFRYFLATMEEN